MFIFFTKKKKEYVKIQEEKETVTMGKVTERNILNVN